MGHSSKDFIKNKQNKALWDFFFPSTETENFSLDSPPVFIVMLSYCNKYYSNSSFNRAWLTLNSLLFFAPIIITTCLPGFDAVLHPFFSHTPPFTVVFKAAFSFLHFFFSKRSHGVRLSVAFVCRREGDKPRGPDHRDGLDLRGLSNRCLPTAASWLRPPISTPCLSRGS